MKLELMNVVNKNDNNNIINNKNNNNNSTKNENDNNKTNRNNKVLLLDLDNTLYPKSSGLDLIVLERIRSYFNDHLQVPVEESLEMAHCYYQDYGLSIKGLIRNSSLFPTFSPEHYDSWVNEGLPLDAISCKGNSNVLLSMLRKVRGNGVLVFIFTNSSSKHMRRTLECLKVETEIDGAFYCDYGEEDFPSKPDPTAFKRVEEELGRLGREEWNWKWRLRRDCLYFVDDSVENIRIAKERGWRVALMDEDGESVYASDAKGGGGVRTLRTINDLLRIFPELGQ